MEQHIKGIYQVAILQASQQAGAADECHLALCERCGLFLPSNKQGCVGINH